ncbi:YycH family regulatory protein [Planococcus glaciei]|uniref:YycH family regulatory protein n=1 Tax=Planococcus glaciei TaxID=459472 RepID=UPI0008829742|nr:two-component system activity regulator YycH [Planococcus glaciei]MBX0316226.1 transcriptional regulator [Planococcus glaciei]SDG85251.1 Two-component signal transduction system YycFG, regulatory protein YycH [Planococcus glaciei]
MKYIEYVKSIALFLLIALSLFLTFIIWTFTPGFDRIETTPAIEVALGKTKTVEEVIQPSKVLYHYNDVVTGTTEKEQVDLLLEVMKQWQIRDVLSLAEEAPMNVLKSYMHEPNRAVLYFPGPVPFPVFDTIMEVSADSIPEASFDRLVIEWGETENTDFTLYFINTRTGRVLQANVSASELEQFQSRVVEPAFNYETFITNEDIGALPIYVPENALEMNTYRYLQEDIVSQKFVDGLFENPGRVQSTGDLANEEYSDESDALMSVDSSHKSINYVQPKAETQDPAIPSELLFETVDFINGHSGWTNDYRYFAMSPLNQQIEYRLYLDNMPVFSPTLSTELELVWGIDAEMEQVFRYKRPFYVLESWAETGAATLPSGKAALHAIAHLKEQDLKKITDIEPGYELTLDDKDPARLLSLQPAWYFKSEGVWTRLTKEELGGGQVGLE